MDLYRIDTKYACGGIITYLGTVVRTAAIFSWMRGKDITEILLWCKKKGFEIEKL